MKWFLELWCGVFGGHEWRRHVGEGRLWLECAKCTASTPGLAVCQRKLAGGGFND